MKTCKAYFDDYNLIHFSYHKSYYNGKVSDFKLIHKGILMPINAIVVGEDEEWIYYKAVLDFKITVGEDYKLLEKNGYREDVKYRLITKTDRFDEEFYTEEPLGSFYFEKYTIFRVWSPFATEAYVKIDNNLYSMTRKEKGVYEKTIHKNLDGREYSYLVKVNGYYVEALDPYAKLTSLQSHKSVVCNDEKIKIDWCDYKIKESKSIYEMSIKDISAYCNKNNSLYLGPLEPVYGYETILDYIKSLNVSHIQLLPVNDFGSVSDEDLSTYNWGYDPISYFALEGSYSKNPSDPYLRVKELKTLINEAHKRGLGVNIDTVFNHVYDTKKHDLNLLVPYYYFRFDGLKETSCSGCRNDTDFERKMFTRLMYDSCMHLFNEYHVDGIRFDLMGLLNFECIGKIYENVKKVHQDPMIYGEAWIMTNHNLVADFKNLKRNENIGGFNDYFRDNILGSPFDLKNVGLLFHNEYKLGFAQDVLNGNHGNDFINHMQSLNYIECHDGYAAYDYVKQDSKKAALGLALVALSKGVSFIHAGQELLCSKNGEENSYNKGIQINGIDFEKQKQNLYVKEMLSTLLDVKAKYYDKNTNIRLFKTEYGLLIDINAKKHLRLIVSWKDGLRVDGNVIYKSNSVLNIDDFALIED
ncbi:MAG: hypothetical protein IJV94_02695 [Bacilli bacterium]|nr:hypothetical protein [Bacilli bacterium]